jgi:iron complex transport system ATP-binding protein
VNAIVARNLCVTYPGLGVALQDVNLNFPAGQITAILGPNGSGKTTLLHALAGLVPRQCGQVDIFGIPLEGYTRRSLGRAVGLVPQEERVAFEFTVLEYVLFGRAPYLGPLQAPGKRDTEIACQALQQVGALPLMSRRLPSLSGGERQLTVIARALAQNPRVLLLDEPAAHLDLSKHGPLRSLLRQLAEAGTAVAFTSHDPNFAASTADRLVLLRRGRVLAEGPLEATFRPELLAETYGVSLRVLDVNGQPLLVES